MQRDEVTKARLIDGINILSKQEMINCLRLFNIDYLMLSMDDDEELYISSDGRCIGVDNGDFNKMFYFTEDSSDYKHFITYDNTTRNTWAATTILCLNIDENEIRELARRFQNLKAFK